MAICKHVCGEKLRNVAGAGRELITSDFSKWDIKFWNKNLLIMDKNLEVIDEVEEKKSIINYKEVVVDNEINRRLDYKYKFVECSMLPSNISVSDLKKKEFTYGDEIHDVVEVFKEKQVLKPKFLKEEKGLSAAERGTVIHYVMQRLNYDRVNSDSEIKAQIEETKSDYDKEQLQERLAKIAGGVAVIGVGAATEVEMKDKKLRIEDALSATKAAVEEGIVAGGGTTYVNIMPSVEKIAKSLTGGEKLGAEIVLKALEEPVKQIARNAGLEPAVILENVKKSADGFGFDADKEQYVDMKKAGIVDPTKVTRSALQNAASIASMVITTESLVADIPEKSCGCGHDNGMGAAGMDGMY